MVRSKRVCVELYKMEIHALHLVFLLVFPFIYENVMMFLHQKRNLKVFTMIDKKFDFLINFFNLITLLFCYEIFSLKILPSSFYI